MKTQGFLKILLAAMAVSFFAYSGSAQQVTMTVDATKTGAPISPYMYGFFTELHEANNEGGFWAEMLGDRKFFHPVDSSKDPEPAPGRRRRATARQVEAPGSGRVRSDGPAEGLRG